MVNIVFSTMMEETNCTKTTKALPQKQKIDLKGNENFRRLANLIKQNQSGNSNHSGLSYSSGG